MCSPFHKSAWIVLVGLALSCGAFAAAPLKVCADPANLPFSSRQQNGFDNRIANVIGAELGRKVEFTWGRMGRGFIREYVNKGQCDLLFGVPKGMRGVLVTRPYYRSI
jgi:mxaJ protein